MERHNTVLIVDDEQVVRETMEALLAGEGLNLIFARNGPEAIEKAIENTPDVILLDVLMPGMNGFEVCRALRMNNRLADVPIIIITGLGDRESLLKGLEAGADDFIAKPYDRIVLKTRIQTTLRLNRYHRLMTERAKFEWVVEQVDDGFLILSDESKIVYHNQQAGIYLGLPDNGIPPSGFDFWPIVLRQYQREPETGWTDWPHKADPTRQYFIVRPETITSQAFWLHVDVLNMNVGLETQYLIRLQDVTTSVLSQRLVWTFHGQVSHKLRTPLSNLQMALLYLKEYATMESTEVDQLLSMAEVGAARLDAEINEIFNYLDIPRIARIEETGCRVNEILSLVKNEITALEIQTVEVTADALLEQSKLYLAISYRALSIILHEVIGNAKKFHPQTQPNLDIEIAFVNDNTKVVLKISDDGLTLSPEQIERIWTPYYQGEKYFSGQVTGMGLGLSVVAALIRDIGGTYCGYNRDKGTGFVVEFTIPVVDPHDLYQ